MRPMVKRLMCPFILLQRYQILSSDEHAGYLRKKNLNPYDYRPDIVHEVSKLQTGPF